MPQYEYKTINLSDTRKRWTEIDLLNEAGADGWRVIHITATGVAYLERMISDPTRAEAPRARATRGGRGGAGGAAGVEPG